MNLAANTALALLVGAAAPQVVSAVFPSSNGDVYLVGSYNEGTSISSKMQIVGPDLWQAYLNLDNATNVVLRFEAPEPDITWGDTATGPLSLPISRQAASPGNPIQIAGVVNAPIRFRLDANGMTYTAEDVFVSTAATNSIWINEIHYKNSGADQNEGIEIAGPAGFDLAGHRVRFVRSAGDFQSPILNLSGVIPDQENGYGTLWFNRPSILNSRAGILLEAPNQQIIQFLSYEGLVTGTVQYIIGRVSEAIPVDQNPLGPATRTMQLTGQGSEYRQFKWESPVSETRGLPNSGQSFIDPILPASVVFENLTLTPAAPDVDEPTSIEIDIIPDNDATNLSPTLLYKTSSTGSYEFIQMVNSGSNTFTTVAPIPGQPIGTLVQYFIHCLFDGPGTNSPAVFPTGAPSATFQYGISRIPFGQFWVNEVNYKPDLLTPNTNEFIELAGIAGLDISGYSIELWDTTGPYVSYTIPAPRKLPNTTNGFGFFVLGDQAVPNVDLVFTNTYSGDSSLAERGAIRILSEFGAPVYVLTYGDPAPTGFGPNAIYIGIDDDFKLEDETISATGTGSNFVNFSYTPDTIPTPSAMNAGQTLQGGNLEPISPAILCPDDLMLQCIADIPAPDPEAVLSLGYCGNNTVTVSLLSESATGGDGCFGSQRVVTRVYQSVSECATTSTCTQIIFIEDTEPPSLLCNTSFLSNPSFEEGDFRRWTVIESEDADVAISLASPRDGLIHARITATNSQSTTQAGFHQTLPASSGQQWLAMGHFQQPVGSLLASNQTAIVQLMFLNAATQVLASAESAPLTGEFPAGFYFRGMVESTSPENTAFVRIQVLLQNDNSSPATVYVDDLVLTPYYAFAVDGCQVAAPDLTTRVTATDNCSSPDIAQIPSAGTLLDIGTHSVQIIASDCGGLTASCILGLSVFDMNPPDISCPPPVYVDDVGSVPPPDPDGVSATAPCGSAVVIHGGDTDNGGAGTEEDSLIITRSYLAVDSNGNTSTCTQIITVGGGEPMPSPVVEIVKFSLSGPTITIDSLGTNTWNVLAEYSTNLVLTPQVWLPVTGATSVYTNGLNRVVFPNPDTNSVFMLYRIQQEP